MINLLKETKDDILRSGHTIADIKFIGSADEEYACTWAEFEVLADVEYDCGYGSAEIAGDLVVRFTDGSHMSRREYDGSECWEFDVPVRRRSSRASKRIRILKHGMWESVAYMNTARKGTK